MTRQEITEMLLVGLLALCVGAMFVLVRWGSAHFAAVHANHPINQELHP